MNAQISQDERISSNPVAKIVYGDPVTFLPHLPKNSMVHWLRCGAAGKGSPLSTSNTSWSKRTAKNQCPSSGSSCRRWGCFAVTATYMSPGDVKALLSFSLISPEGGTAIKLLWFLNKVSLAEDSGIEQKSPNISIYMSHLKHKVTGEIYTRIGISRNL